MNSRAAAQVETPQTRRSGRSHGRMHLLMLVVMVCWAGNIVAGKEALTGFGPLALAQLRLLGTAVIYGTLFLAWRKRPALRLDLRQWSLLALMALNGATLNQIFFIGGLARTTVAHTGLIVALGPVMVLVLACLMRLEPLTVLKLAGMLISFAGVAILTAAGAEGRSSGTWAGDLLLLAGGAVFAYFTILVKEVGGRYDALTLNTLVFVLGALFMVPFSARALWNVPWGSLHAPAWWGLAFMVVLGSVVPYLLFAIALTELAASRVAAFNYLQPVMATALGIWLLAERLTLRVVAGGAIILLGVYLTERERGEEEEVPGVAQGAA